MCACEGEWQAPTNTMPDAMHVSQASAVIHLNQAQAEARQEQLISQNSRLWPGSCRRVSLCYCLRLPKAPVFRPLACPRHQASSPVAPAYLVCPSHQMWLPHSPASHVHPSYQIGCPKAPASLNEHAAACSPISHSWPCRVMHSQPQPHQVGLCGFGRDQAGLLFVVFNSQY